MSLLLHLPLLAWRLSVPVTQSMPAEKTPFALIFLCLCLLLCLCLSAKQAIQGFDDLYCALCSSLHQANSICLLWLLLLLLLVRLRLRLCLRLRLLLLTLLAEARCSLPMHSLLLRLHLAATWPVAVAVGAAAAASHWWWFGCCRCCCCCCGCSTDKVSA